MMKLTPSISWALEKVPSLVHFVRILEKTDRRLTLLPISFSEHDPVGEAGHVDGHDDGGDRHRRCLRLSGHRRGAGTREGA